MSKIKLGWPSVRTLRNLAAGRRIDFGVWGMSEHGGLTAVVRCLRRHGLIDLDQRITAAGREWLAANDREGKR